MAKKNKDKKTVKIETVETPVTEKPIEDVKNTDSTEKAKVVEPEKEPVKKEPDHPACPLEVFCKLSGKKPDQIAGFRRYAISAKLKPMTILKWREKLVEFQNKPMR